MLRGCLAGGGGGGGGGGGRFRIASWLSSCIDAKYSLDFFDAGFQHQTKRQGTYVHCITMRVELYHRKCELITLEWNEVQAIFKFNN